MHTWEKQKQKKKQFNKWKIWSFWSFAWLYVSYYLRFIAPIKCFAFILDSIIYFFIPLHDWPIFHCSKRRDNVCLYLHNLCSHTIVNAVWTLILFFYFVLFVCVFLWDVKCSRLKLNGSEWSGPSTKNNISYIYIDMVLQ